MADVKWIKIVTDLFEDEKIVLIEQMPKGDSILLVWFKLLCLAGKQNNSGVFAMKNGKPYTADMLAAIFRCEPELFKQALETFEGFGMVEITDGVITIPNWGKHQNLDAVESRNEYMREYMQEYRERQKAIAKGEAGCKVNSKLNSKVNSKLNVNINSKQCKVNSKPNSKPNCKPNCKPNVNSLEEEIDIDIDIDKDLKEKEIYKEKEKADAVDSATAPPKKTKHKYGEYKNVLLTDDELEKLKAEFPQDWQERIERLSEYIASTGRKYKNHLATIRVWARKSGGQQKARERPPEETAPINPAYRTDVAERLAKEYGLNV